MQEKKLDDNSLLANLREFKVKQSLDHHEFVKKS
jgi:hypothetical protein